MPVHSERRRLPYTPRQLYDIVAAVDLYPEFLPWCVATRIKRREGPVFWSDMVIGFKMVREKFTSRVTLTDGERIDVAYEDGPFKYLENNWLFEDDGQGGCIIDFHVDFEFKSRVLEKLIGVLFNEAVRKLVGAFEARAKALYGAG